MKLVCVMHAVYNDVVLFEINDSKSKCFCSIYFHSNVPILIKKWPNISRRNANQWRICSDKASLLQLRRVKQLTNADYSQIPELQPDDMSSKVMELIGEALVARMDEIFTGA